MKENDYILEIFCRVFGIEITSHSHNQRLDE